jgi:hypothetical protein
LTVCRHRDAEVIIRRAITGHEFYLFGPLLGGPGKNVGRPLKSVRAYRGKVRADDCRISGQANALAEIVKRNAIRSTQFRLLCPGSANECKYVCCAAVPFAIERSAEGATQRSVTIQGDSEAKSVKGLSIIGC